MAVRGVVIDLHLIAHLQPEYYKRFHKDYTDQQIIESFVKYLNSVTPKAQGSVMLAQFEIISKKLPRTEAEKINKVLEIKNGQKEEAKAKSKAQREVTSKPEPKAKDKQEVKKKRQAVNKSKKV